MFACDEVQNTETQELSIFAYTKDKVFFGDTLSIFGSNISENNTSLLAVKTKDTIDLSHKISIVNNSEIRYLNDSLSGSYSLFLKNKDLSSNFVDVEFFNFPDIQTKIIEGGNFLMGSEKGTNDERPTRDVEITHKLEVSIYEISEFTYYSVLPGDLKFTLNRRKPASNIAWDQAIIFCNKLSNLFGYDSAYSITDNKISFDISKDGWRLPTEAEWEFLAKAGKENLDSPENFEDIAWYNQNSGYNIQISGMKNPNEFGLYDMQGNLFEWCWDYYAPYLQSDLTDPEGSESGDFRVMRGGSFISGQNDIRVTARNFEEDDSFAGIRLVRTIIE